MEFSNSFHFYLLSPLARPVIWRRLRRRGGSRSGQAISADARRRPRGHRRRRAAGQRGGAESGGRAALRVERCRARGRAVQPPHNPGLPESVRRAGRERWRLAARPSAEAQGPPVTTVLTLVSDATREPIDSIPARCLREGRAVDMDDGALLVRRDGTEIAIGDSAALLRDRDGTKVGVVLVLHDVTERRRVARKLHHQATHDPLTGLLGRKEVDERLARLNAEAARRVAQHALCYLGP